MTSLYKRSDQVALHDLTIAQVEVLQNVTNAKLMSKRASDFTSNYRGVGRFIVLDSNDMDDAKIDDIISTIKTECSEDD